MKPILKALVLSAALVAFLPMSRGSMFVNFDVGPLTIHETDSDGGNQVVGYSPEFTSPGGWGSPYLSLGVSIPQIPGFLYNANPYYAVDFPYDPTTKAWWFAVVYPDPAHGYVSVGLYEHCSLDQSFADYDRVSVLDGLGGALATAYSPDWQSFNLSVHGYVDDPSDSASVKLGTLNILLDYLPAPPIPDATETLPGLAISFLALLAVGGKARQQTLAFASGNRA